MRPLRSNVALLCVLLAAFVSVPCLARWGTLDEAASLYRRNSKVFRSIVQSLNANGALRYIDSATDVRSLREGETLYGPITPSVTTTYRVLARQIDKLGINNINVIRKNNAANGPMVIVIFNVFGRGYGGASEGIDIEWVANGYDVENFNYTVQPCRKLEAHWYVCHIG